MDVIGKKIFMLGLSITMSPGNLKRGSLPIYGQSRPAKINAIPKPINVRCMAMSPFYNFVFSDVLIRVSSRRIASSRLLHSNSTGLMKMICDRYFRFIRIVER